MRYVKLENAEFDIPDQYGGILDLMTEGHEYDVENFFRDIYHYGVNGAITNTHLDKEFQVKFSDPMPPEDARRILPIGTKTNIVFSANLRALIDFCSVRRCVMAQTEIHKLANAIRREIYKIDPLLGRVLMIKCEKSGACDEERNKDNKVCGIRPHIDSLNLKTLNILREDK